MQCFLLSSIRACFCISNLLCVIGLNIDSIFTLFGIYKNSVCCIDEVIIVSINVTSIGHYHSGSITLCQILCDPKRILVGFNNNKSNPTFAKKKFCLHDYINNQFRQAFSQKFRFLDSMLILLQTLIHYIYFYLKSFHHGIDIYFSLYTCFGRAILISFCLSAHLSVYLFIYCLYLKFALVDVHEHR